MAETTIPFSPEAGDAALNAAPSQPAVFVLRGHNVDAEPYIGRTSDLRRRLKRLLDPLRERSKRLNLRERVAKISWTATGSDFETWLVLYRTFRELFAANYRDRLRLAPAPVIRISWENAFPRAYVTNRLSQRAGYSAFYGPFPSRTVAEGYLNDVLDLFRMRRCVEDLNPDPAFPGCIYSEMKMCLAPCFKGCSGDEYAHESQRVGAFLDSNGKSLIAETAAERDQASEAMEFELAAALHARIEKISRIAAAAPETVHRLDRLDAVIVQPAAIPEHVALFRVYQGTIGPAALFPVSTIQHPNPASGSSSLYLHARTAEPIPENVMTAKSASLEARIQEFLCQMPVEHASSAAELAEHLALLKRWYYRSSKLRVGEIFFAAGGEFLGRRIARGISRVYRGEREAAVQTSSPASP